MAKKPTPLFAKSKTAAALLEMSEREFLSLVDEGSLPPAVRFDRWDIEQLSKVMHGDNIEGLGGVNW